MKKTCAIFISILCLALISGSAIFIYNQNTNNPTNKTPQSSLEPNTENQVSETTETSETADTSETNQTTKYTNHNFSLELEIPQNWTIETDEHKTAGYKQSLLLVLVSNENPETNITISTPPQEIGFGPAKISEGLSYQIQNNQQISSNLYSFENGRLINKNIYERSVATDSEPIEITLASDGNNFDKHLPTYYAVIDSLKFN